MESKLENEMDLTQDPRDCTYRLGASIKRHLRDVLRSKQKDRVSKAVIKKVLADAGEKKNLFTYEMISDVHKYLQRADNNYNEYFHEFLAKCKCFLPKPRKNPQLDERIRQLKLQQSILEYKRMTSMFHSSKPVKAQDPQKNDRNQIKADLNDDGSIGYDVRALRGSLIAVINSFLVIICTFIFCYKAVEYSLHSPHIPAQVLFGLIGSTIVAIAELYFIMRVM